MRQKTYVPNGKRRRRICGRGMKMILFPAIDILEGRAVRLFKGDKSRVTDYGNPLGFAEKWADEGAEWLHVVDLSGAFSGESGIDSEISEIKKRVGVKIQSGGGLRTLDDIARRLDAGADRVVIGTMAVAHPDDFALAVYRWGEKIVAGIDAKDGFFAVKGWTKTTPVRADEFGRKCRRMGLGYALFTDISKDGAMQGVNIPETVRMQEETGLKVIASGGVSSLEDIAGLKARGVYGAVLGRSIYDGAVRLKDAFRTAKD